MFSAYGCCEYCLTGWETLCEGQQNGGYSVDGGYAEYVVQEAIRFSVEGKVKSTVHAAKLEDINTIFEDMKKGAIDGRVVLQIAEP